MEMTQDHAGLHTGPPRVTPAPGSLQQLAQGPPPWLTQLPGLEHSFSKAPQPTSPVSGYTSLAEPGSQTGSYLTLRSPQSRSQVPRMAGLERVF